MRLIGTMLTFVLLIWAGTCYAGNIKYEVYFTQAANKYDQDKYLLVAMGKVESNFNPLAYNVNKNGTVDIGLMMTNSTHLRLLRAAGFQRIDLLDPQTSIFLGAFVLNNCIKRYGRTWRAVGCYNAGSEANRKIYADKVKAAYEKIVAAEHATPRANPLGPRTPQIATNAQQPPRLRIITGRDA